MSIELNGEISMLLLQFSIVRFLYSTVIQRKKFTNSIQAVFLILSNWNGVDFKWQKKFICSR